MRGFTTDATHWLLVEDAATFAFEETGDVRVDPEGDLAQRELDDLWRRAVLPLVVQARRTQVLHASAVRREDGAIVALCGTATSGKSTLAAALMRAGLEVVADDALAFTPDDAGVFARPLPFRLRLRPSAAEALKLPPVVLERDAPAAAWLAEVVLLDPRDSGPATLQAVQAFSAYAQLMPHAYCFSLELGKADLVRDYAALLAHLTVLRLSYPRGLDRLAEAVEALEPLVAVS
jgi:hypothetical protein